MGMKSYKLPNHMVARGNNRNDGANLGIAYVNANNALSNSNGNNWRSRVSLSAGSEMTRPDFGAEPETPLKAIDRNARTCRRSFRAVKDVRRRSVSRQFAARTGAAQEGIGK